MPLLVKTALPVWIAVAIGAVLIGAFVERSAHIDFVVMLLAASIILTFFVQIASVQSSGQKEGLVSRVMATVGGSIAVLAVATAVLTVI